MNGAPPETHIPSWRLRATYIVLFAVLAVFVARLYQLQVIEYEAHLRDAEENRFSELSMPAPRGVIYDRNGYQLVRNIPSYNVVVTPAQLPDSPAEVETIYQRLSDLTGVPVDQPGPAAARCVPGRGILQLVEEGATNRPYESWPIACDVDEITARIVQQQAIDMPGVSVEAIPVRDYTTGELTAAIIGYLGPIPASESVALEELGFDPARDKIGYAGIEAEYQDLLAGTNGLKLVEVDVAQQQLREYGAVIQPVPGNSLRLSIDTRLQAAAATALRSRMDFMNRFAGEIRTPLGVVIALNPQTGEILAMVSLPTYENNRFARFIPLDYYQQLVADERGKPLINHAVTSPFPPGSTFKLVTAIGALQEGIVTPNQTINDPGVITISNQYFPNDPGKAKEFVCWNRDGHGRVNMLIGIAESCNVYFYKIGGGFENEVPVGLGIGGINDYAPSLGYGSPLGIDLPGEVGGLIPNEDWKRINLGESWSTGDTYHSVTGQGFVLATPLQVLNSVATLANGGRVMWPHLVQEVLDGEGNVVEAYEPRVLWDISDGVLTSPQDQLVDRWVIELVEQGMHLVTTEGTASGYADLETISSAGKTGTGEFCDALALRRNLCIPGNWPTHSWYAAYAPFENPEIAV
ncbi:MAG TPA: penicillin-binding protein 2, partial [Anaerolineales bacterium]|nr:penicillin-binding protein 2 [Anaerolineales bacterium]